MPLKFGSKPWKFNELVFTKNAAWKRISVGEYLGLTVDGTIHVFRKVTPTGCTGWEFRDRNGEVLTRIRATKTRGCTAVQAITCFGKRYLGEK